jgi:hypothetical protein
MSTLPSQGTKLAATEETTIWLAIGGVTSAYTVSITSTICE